LLLNTQVRGLGNKAVLEANQACVEILRTRAQGWGEGLHLIQNLWDTVAQSIVGVETAVVGTGALAATIAAIPVSYGAAALALIPAVAGFSLAAVASIDSLVAAAKSAGATGMSIYYLARSADSHPINQLLAIVSTKDNLLNIINSKYLKDKNGEWVLKSKLKGPDSL
jgi:hypothetical protein